MADKTIKKPGKKPSVTSHPLFPAIVMVWFAALFGLVSLAIHPSVIESLVLATGIDHVIAKAAPPLGNTTRMLLALLMTALGAVVGLLVARRLVRPPAAKSARRRDTLKVDEGISPVTSFGRAEPIAARLEDQDEDIEPPLARRRQQLALLDHDDDTDEEASREDEIASNGQILDVGELPLKSFDEIDGIWLHESDREIRAKADGDEAAVFADPQADLAAMGEQETFAEDETSIWSKTDQAKDTSGTSGNRLFDAYVHRQNASLDTPDRDDRAPGFVSLSDSDELDQLSAITSAPIDTDVPAYSNTAERIASAPLDELSHVELLERLAQTIARRRAQTQDAGSPPAAIQVDEVPNVAVLPRFSAPQVVRPEGEIPAALRPQWVIAQDLDGEDGEALPAYVPARSIAMPHHASTNVTPINPADADDALEDGYSSLQGMSKRADAVQSGADAEVPSSDAPQPGRFSAPDQHARFSAPTTPAPVGPRPFDGGPAAEPAADQTEQALRAALATLRRMSGTA